MPRIRTGATEMSEPIIQSFLQDFRYGVRILRKSPGFSAIAILSLALGIMAATAMYSVIYGVVLNPFPYRDVDSLMSVKIWSPDQSGYRVGYTVDQFLEIAERNTILLLPPSMQSCGAVKASPSAFAAMSAR